MKTIAALLALAAASVVAATTPSWTKVGATPASTKMEFTVALPQQNLDVLDKLFWDVSTPGSASYGKFVSMDKLNSLTAPSSAHVTKVQRVLAEAGMDCSVSGSGSSIRCVGSAAAVSSLLGGAKVNHYKNAQTGAEVHRVLGDYTFPKALQGDVRFIGGLNQLPKPSRHGRTHAVKTGEGDLSVTPETIKSFYNIGSHTASKDITQSAFEFQDLTAWSQGDLTNFITNTGVKSWTVDKKIGPFNNQPQAESTLDVQYIGSTGEGATNFYYTSANWMYDMTEDMLSNNGYGIDVVSMSYGWSETAQCQIDAGSAPCTSGGSKNFVDTVNTNFQKLGAAGITLLASSGDSGAHGRTDGFCLTEKADPAYPASSPFITAVGATQIKKGTGSTAGATEPICKDQLQCATSGTEIVCSNAEGALITSGGGFSNFAPRPAYQEAAVAAYLKNAGAVPPTGDFNATGRGYPDVAALGHAYYIELQGQAVGVDGTSCAAPVFSGVLALLNAYLVEAGKPKLGFANPLLYKMAAEHPATFNDITVGTNKCTSFLCTGCTGFEATAGWDAATGMGTPNLKEMLAYLSAKNGMAVPSQTIKDAANKMQQRVNKMFNPAIRGMGVEGLMREA